MDFKQTLSELKVAIDRELQQYFDTAIEKAKKDDELIAKALEQSKKIALSGGKRVRGILLQIGYFGVGGKEKKKILKVAVAFELLHLFFLIHDDIIDRGNLRHGQVTLHNFFAKKTNKKSGSENSLHLGNSVAIIIGDMFFAKANEMILTAGFGEKETIKALAFLKSVVASTIVGQAQDIAIENVGRASKERILQMYENKTAQYTFVAPLQMGAILAGSKDKKIQAVFSQYGLSLGKAYQLQDDIMGIFSRKEKIGKSTISDIEEGKLSLMVARAMECANSGERKILAGILGKKNLTKKEIQQFKDILEKTGAKKYTQDLALEYFIEGKSQIAKAVLMQKSKNFLIELVDYLQTREA